MTCGLGGDIVTIGTSKKTILKLPYHSISTIVTRLIQDGHMLLLSCIRFYAKRVFASAREVICHKCQNCK